MSYKKLYGEKIDFDISEGIQFFFCYGIVRNYQSTCICQSSKCAI